jgi:hypothetical protein
MDLFSELEQTLEHASNTHPDLAAVDLLIERLEHDLRQGRFRAVKEGFAADAVVSPAGENPLKFIK